MHLAETDEQLAMRLQLRAYFAELLPPEVRAEVGHVGDGSPVFRRIVRRLGADGWLGLGWPVEYGGQGRSAIEQFIMFDEIQRAKVPFPFVTVNTVGPAIMAFGTDEQKRRYLPGILSGETNFAIGYTEPGAGTDLASLRTSAVLDGDQWLVNGNKVFTSGANQADFIWLACRTDPDVPKHKGITILIVPTSSPGFSWTPIHTVGGSTTTATYYDDVRGPGRQRGRRGERRLAADHRAAQPRAGRTRRDVAASPCDCSTRSSSGHGPRLPVRGHRIGSPTSRGCSPTSRDAGH